MRRLEEFSAFNSMGPTLTPPPRHPQSTSLRAFAGVDFVVDTCIGLGLQQQRNKILLHAAAPSVSSQVLVSVTTALRITQK